jgi:hypothetical protein
MWQVASCAAVGGTNDLLIIAGTTLTSVFLWLTVMELFKQALAGRMQ